jgi:hypothetical protein
MLRAKVHISRGVFRLAMQAGAKTRRSIAAANLRIAPACEILHNS